MSNKVHVCHKYDPRHVDGILLAYNGNTDVLEIKAYSFLICNNGFQDRQDTDPYTVTKILLYHLLFIILPPDINNTILSV